MENLKREIDFSNTTLKNVKFNGTITRYGQEINQMSLLGLNPIWAFNFGDPSVAASATEAGAKDTVLTPIGTLFNLSLALAKVASQSDELTIAQSTELLGSTASASTSAPIAAGATNTLIPDDLNITRVTGNLASTLTLTASTIDYQANESFLVIFKGGNVFTASQVLTFTTHADAECENNTDEVTLKICIRTTGGTIAVTFT